MENKKTTKRELFQAIFTHFEENGDDLHGLISNEELLDRLAHEIELLDKKKSAEKKPTPKDEKNEVIRAAILNALSDGTAMTITDMLKNIPECADITNQHCSSIVRVLKEEQIVERFEEKRKAYFRMK
jgi:hypothetical protein